MKCMEDEKVVDNRCHVSSPFHIWVGPIDFIKYKYTLVFGEVIEGLKMLAVRIVNIYIYYLSNI